MARQTRRELLTKPAPAPFDELVNVLEFEAEAAKRLADDVARAIAGSDRAAFDRITFRPRMMVNCVDLSLAAELFGIPLFAPILVGPVADQRRFDPEAEAATALGAAAAKSAMVVSRRSSVPVASLSKAGAPLIYQLFADDSAAALRAQAADAEQAGCRAIILTIGADGTRDRRPTGRDWAALETLRASTTLPVAAKGVTTSADALAAIARGAQALVVSNYGHADAPGRPAALDALPAVVAAVGPDVPVLVDGGVRRGTDIMKALALGARAVLVARPVMWGLAAYGAGGVQAVLELLQTELARVMGCCGTPTLAAITPAVVKVHRPAVLPRPTP